MWAPKESVKDRETGVEGITETKGREYFKGREVSRVRWWWELSKVRTNFFGGNSLAVQWLWLVTVTAQGPGSVPGQETKTPQAAWQGQKKRKKIFVFIWQHGVHYEAFWTSRIVKFIFKLMLLKLLN